jgi:protein-L-isoaspartate(D-aspartate) O-methyltransferase
LGSQLLKRFTRIGEDNFNEEVLLDCRFVPLIGMNGWQEEG